MSVARLFTIKNPPTQTLLIENIVSRRSGGGGGWIIIRPVNLVNTG